MPVLLHIAVGGALGGLARFAVGAWVVGWAGTGFPIATLGVNVGGAFVLGVLSGLLPAAGMSIERQALLTVGFCGGFTTFSTFSWEALELLERADYGAAFIYVALTAVLGPLAYVAGSAGGERRAV
jgi:fluoride exporter